MCKRERHSMDCYWYSSSSIILCIVRHIRCIRRTRVEKNPGLVKQPNFSFFYYPQNQVFLLNKSTKNHSYGAFALAVAIIIIATLSIIATVMAVLALAPMIDQLGSSNDPEGDRKSTRLN